MVDNYNEVIKRFSKTAYNFLRQYQTDIIIAGDDESSKIDDFTIDFLSNGNCWKILTENEFNSVMTRIQERQILTAFVFSLRGHVISQFTYNEIKAIAESFSWANSNTEDKFSTYPTDSATWTVSQSELLNRYMSNLWILPLLALGIEYSDKQA